MNRKSYFSMKVVNTIRGLFFKGLLGVVPIWVSGYVIYWIITTLNNAFSFVVGPGYGLLIVLASITLIGMLVNYMVTDPISRFFNSFLDRMRSEEHTSELQSLMRISYAVFCLKTKKLYYVYNIYHHQSSNNSTY